MELFDVMLKRRSIRKYLDSEIPDEKIEKILNAGLLAPTSRNRKLCEFIVIKNQVILKKLSQAKKTGGKMLASCNAAICVAVDAKKSDTWIEDSSIALAFMHLMATNVGIGSCWCQIHLRSSVSGKDAEETVRELLSLDDKYRIVGILALGVPSKEGKPHTLGELDLSKITVV